MHAGSITCSIKTIERLRRHHNAHAHAHVALLIKCRAWICFFYDANASLRKLPIVRPACLEPCHIASPRIHHMLRALFTMVSEFCLGGTSFLHCFIGGFSCISICACFCGCNIAPSTRCIANYNLVATPPAVHTTQLASSLFRDTRFFGVGKQR